MTDERTKAAVMAAFTQYLAQHRLRHTPARIAVLERVLAMPGHFWIEMLTSSNIDAQGVSVSRATVYNTIELLTDAGLLRRHTFGNNTAQYELVSGPANHHHLVCTRCGKVKEIKDPEIDRQLATRHFSGFTPAYTDLYIYGLCSRCSRKKKQKKI